MSDKKGLLKYEEEMELRRGPWTLEEDSLLVHYIACHGEGSWNLLARCSGLKRTGKSCRLRWLNYLKPDVKRGNLSPEEQFLILELHSKWGNRWSRIAQYLPGRTDNEIKNYWRTRVQKQARQLKIDANSTMFRDAVRCYWMPMLLEKMEANAPINTAQSLHQTTPSTTIAAAPNPHDVAPPPECFHPSMQSAGLDNSSCYELSASENCSPSISSGSPAFAQLAKLSEFTTYSCEELGEVPFSAYVVSDHLIMNNNSYDLDRLDLAAAAAAVYPNNPAAASGGAPAPLPENNYGCSIGSSSSSWGMDELWQVRKVHQWGGDNNF